MQMSRLLNLTGLSEEQLQAVNEISDILGISISNDSIPIKCCKKDHLEYGFDGQNGHIFYVSDHQFTRGLVYKLSLIWEEFCIGVLFQKSMIAMIYYLPIVKRPMSWLIQCLALCQKTLPEKVTLWLSGW